MTEHDLMTAQNEGQNMTSTLNDHEIPLTAVWANAQKDEIAIQGNGEESLKRDSGPHTFKFVLDDKTGTNVRFKAVDDPNVGTPMLWAKDDCTVCPPAQSSSSLIDNVKRKSDTEASFRDKNDNKTPNVKVGYQLNFDCDDKNVTKPIAFDPVLDNGGKS